jgi:uncharacterized protein YkwD
MMQRKDAVVGSIVLMFAMALATSAGLAARRAAGDGCTGTTVRAATADARRVADDAILCLVNRERSRRGLAAVRLSKALSRSATAHSEDMAQSKFFSHVGSGGTSIRQRVDRSGYLRGSDDRVGETIAWGSAEFGTPAQLMGALMGSPGHRRVILDRRFRDVGVGLVSGVPVRASSDDGATLTLVFGRRR